MKKQYKVTKTSIISGVEHSLWINMDLEDYDAWQKGKSIQYALPYLTSGEREFWITLRMTTNENT